MSLSQTIRSAIYDILSYSLSIPIISFETQPNLNISKIVILGGIDERDSNIKCKSLNIRNLDVIIKVLFKQIQKQSSYEDMEQAAFDIQNLLDNVALDITPYECLDCSFVSSTTDIQDDGVGVWLQKTLIFKIVCIK